jgi:hypothetical protein
MTPVILDAAPPTSEGLHVSRMRSRVPNPKLFIRGLLTFASAAAISCGGDATEPEPPAAAARLIIVSGDRQTATVGTELPAPVVLQVLSSRGRPVRGATVDFALEGGGQIAAERLLSDETGRLQQRWTLGTSTSAAQRLTARLLVQADSTSGSVVRVLVATPSAGPAEQIGITTPAVSAHVAAGQAFDTPIGVSLQDHYGNAVAKSGVLVSASLGDTAGGRLLIGDASASTSTDGVATFSTLRIGGRAGPATLVASSAGLTPASLVVKLTAGLPSRLALLEPTTMTGTALQAAPPLHAMVTDEWENPVAGVPVTFALVSSATILGTVVSDSLGVATLSAWRFPAVGTYAISVAASGIGQTLMISLTIRAGVVARLEYITSSAIASQAGRTGPPISVRAFDAEGFPVGSADLVLTLSPAIVIAHATTDFSGVATFDSWKVPTKAGTYALAVSVANVSPLTFSLISLVGPPARVVPIQGNSGSAFVGTYYELGVRVEDEVGNPVTGTPVAWSLVSPGPNARLPVSTPTSTDLVGAAFTVIFTQTAPGTNRVRAAAGGVNTPVVSIDLLVTSKAGPPISIGSVSSVPDAMRINSPFPVSATVLDSWGNGVPDVVVSSFVGRALGAIQPAQTTTDVLGRFSFNATLGSLAGLNTFLALAPGAVNRVGWELRATADQPAIVPLKQVEPPVGGQYGLIVYANAADGRGMGGVSIEWSAAPGSGEISDQVTGFQTSVIRLTDSDGASLIVWHAPTVRGTYSVTARGPSSFANNVITYTVTVP